MMRSGVFLTNFVLGCQLTVNFQYGEYGLWHFGVVLSWLKLVPLLQKDRKMAKHANLAATWSQMHCELLTIFPTIMHPLIQHSTFVKFIMITHTPCTRS